MSNSNSSIPILITRWWAKFRAYNTNYEVQHTNPKFSEVKELLKGGKIREAISMLKAVESSNKTVKTVDNDVVIAGKVASKGLSKLYQESANVVDSEAMRKFMVNASQNPNPNSQSSLSEFLTKNGVCLTDRGTMLLYKRVKPNYTDCHSGTFDNSPGKLVWVDRSKVDPDSARACSYGLHVCSHQYLGNFNGGHSQYSSSANPTVVVEVDPRDVVSVPNDCGSSKIRVCRYRVLMDARDLNRFGMSDFLGNMKFITMAQVSELVKYARFNPPPAGVSAEWRGTVLNPGAPGTVTTPTADKPAKALKTAPEKAPQKTAKPLPKPTKKAKASKKSRRKRGR
jgi:hypothetical protein